MASTPNIMEAKFSRILLKALIMHDSTLHQAPTIKNFFTLKGSMYPITAKFIHVIIQTKYNKVYTVQK